MQMLRFRRFLCKTCVYLKFYTGSNYYKYYVGFLVVINHRAPVVPSLLRSRRGSCLSATLHFTISA